MNVELILKNQIAIMEVLRSNTKNEWHSKNLKEQTMNAWMHGLEEIQPYIDSSEDYYNETFKSE